MYITQTKPCYVVAYTFCQFKIKNIHKAGNLKSKETHRYSGVGSTDINFATIMHSRAKEKNEWQASPLKGYN
jgi:hypothetical protein